MQKFEYRIPRYVVDLPILFIQEDSSVSGRCHEISKEGMSVAFQEPVALRACGAIRLTHKDISIELRAQVAHSGGGRDGLKFLFDSDKDRAAVEKLVAILSGSTGLPGLTLV